MAGFAEGHWILQNYFTKGNRSREQKKNKRRRGATREYFMKVLKTHMKIATAVAIRAAVATNINHKNNGDRRLAKQFQKSFCKWQQISRTKKNKRGNGGNARIIYKSIKNAYENGNGRCHKTDGGGQHLPYERRWRPILHRRLAKKNCNWQLRLRTKKKQSRGAGRE